MCSFKTSSKCSPKNKLTQDKLWRETKNAAGNKLKLLLSIMSETHPTNIDFEFSLSKNIRRGLVQSKLIKKVF